MITLQQPVSERTQGIGMDSDRLVARQLINDLANYDYPSQDGDSNKNTHRATRLKGAQIRIISKDAHRNQFKRIGYNFKDLNYKHDLSNLTGLKTRFWMSLSATQRGHTIELMVYFIAEYLVRTYTIWHMDFRAKDDKFSAIV